VFMPVVLLIFDILVTQAIQISIVCQNFCVIKSCVVYIILICPAGGDSGLLQNIHSHLPNYTASYLKDLLA